MREIYKNFHFTDKEFMDFFAVAAPCNPLGRYAQNDNALPFLQVDFSLSIESSK